MLNYAEVGSSSFANSRNVGRISLEKLEEDPWGRAYKTKKTKAALEIEIPARENPILKKLFFDTRLQSERPMI